MAKTVRVRLGGKVQKFDEAALRALPRKAQITVAVALGLQLQRGVSKNGLVKLILAK